MYTEETNALRFVGRAYFRFRARATDRTFRLYMISAVIVMMGGITASMEQDVTYAKIGKNLTIDCLTMSPNVKRKHNNETIDTQNKRYSFSIKAIKNENNSNELTDEKNVIYNHSLLIHNVEISDKGIYTCDNAVNETYRNIFIQPILLPKITAKNKPVVKQKIKQGVTLFCLIECYPIDENFQTKLKWLKDENTFPFLDQSSSIKIVNSTHLNYTLELAEVYKKENGSYSCVVHHGDGDGGDGHVTNEIERGDTALLVMDKPQVSIDFAKAVGASKIYLNWTVNDGNDPIHLYFIQHSPEHSQAFTYYKHAIGGRNTSYILENFAPNTSYVLKISAKNSIGEGVATKYHMPVRTLAEDPIFIPKVETTGSTPSTITIGWDPPPPALLDYIHYYEIVVTEAGDIPQFVESAIHSQNSRNLPYMFDNLKTATEYEFKARACSDLTKLCGPWSEIVNGTTMDGVASKPLDLQVTCVQQAFPQLNSVEVSWKPPKNPNGKIVSYQLYLDGLSTYKIDGKLHNETWGPKIRRVDEPNHKTLYEGVHPNTNYTVTIVAITRHRKNGEPAVGRCTMPITVPETIQRAMWTKIKTSDSKCVFKLFLPKVNERNGPICCYRIYLVRMGNNNELPSPDQINVMTYAEVHALNNSIEGAYIAEMFPGDAFNSEILLGDGKRFQNNNNELTAHDAACRKCLEGQPFLRRRTPNQFLTETIATTESSLKSSQREKINKAGNLTESASRILYNNKFLRKRNLKSSGPVGENSQSFLDKEERNPKAVNFNLDFSLKPQPQSPDVQMNNYPATILQEIFDGEIDIISNYTGFFEVIVRDNDSVLTAYSNYFEIMTPGTAAEQSDAYEFDTSAILNVVIQILAVLIGIALVLLIALCFLRHYNRKNSGTGEEVISLRDSLSRLFGGRSNNHHGHFIGSSNIKASDVGPISKSDLIAAYTYRHKDTDYGFLREYEMLPNRFSDRTTKNSDMKENAMKNRYPDIKAFDQTRVKLSQINGIQGADYINANFVIGYKERKKFICAQGPMETTVNDFWRMIWEQHLEIIVMLTNLEEYNKSKCAKYWPEKILDVKQFGEITVKFVSERKSGEYLVRILDVFRRSFTSNDDGGGGGDQERRQITQYHYLVWKDFMAPEHPHGILKFIRHINAVYSVQRGPILVHCSAGVGRTGTLVALDCLMQQLEEENQVSIYNTVCDLRHQRNFLVQSLKQYIFLYRALLETAHFGNTELSVVNLSTTIENLKVKPNEGKDKCKLEIEFEKLFTVVDETNKSSSVASNEANMSKNRSEIVLPYDRNRVILSPVPSKENSTYINASFIEGYDNNCTFIITQDPMEHTIGDFWRMISEQSSSTLIMISEIGDGPRKSPRYWADDEIHYDHILVKYMQSESCPYYTRREFIVTNCKINDTIKVTQLQYNGWPTVDGEVPEVCRGMIELVDQAQIHHNKEKNIGCKSPITVHCSLGTDRSSIFVAMTILVQQLRTEKCVDICSLVRKLRTQRPRLINSYAQYEFLHRAIANYADLHKLSTESPPPEC